MFVLALICLVYAMVQRYARKAEGEIAAAGWRAAVRQALLEPYVWLLGFFIGLFHWNQLLGFCDLLCDGRPGGDLLQLPEIQPAAEPPGGAAVYGPDPA